jgi:hypothetical protein
MIFCILNRDTENRLEVNVLLKFSKKKSLKAEISEKKETIFLDAIVIGLWFVE